MAVLHAVPSVRDMPPAPQSPLPMYFAPVFAGMGVAGLAAVSWELPAILLLCSTGERSALALLRAYWTGRMICGGLALLSPALFLGLTFLLYWRTARRLDPELRRQNRLASLILLPVCLPLAGIVMWSALAPGGSLAFCNQAAADIRQIETGELERVTVLLEERSSPDSLFQDAPEGWRVTWRKGLGPDTGFQWVSLRFSDALDFTPVPERFVVTGQTYDWNWTHAQRYEITYTTQFHLVVSAVPVGGAP